MKWPPGLMCLNTWFPAGDALWEGCETFREWITGDSPLAFRVLLSSIPAFLTMLFSWSCWLSHSRNWVLFNIFSWQYSYFVLFQCDNVLCQLLKHFTKAFKYRDYTIYINLSILIFWRFLSYNTFTIAFIDEEINQHNFHLIYLEMLW